jgi:putative oxidoreductase
VETVGGAALILGVAVPLVALLLVLDMLGAFLFVHLGHGLFVEETGAELVLALGAAALVFAAVGPGRYSVDAAFAAQRERTAVAV